MDTVSWQWHEPLLENQVALAKTMTGRNWKFHGGRIIAAGVLLFLCGWLIGYPVEVLEIGLISYVIWHLVNVWRLHIWLHHPQQDVPESKGIWAEIFDSIRDFDQRRRQQELLYKNVITEFQNLTNAHPDATLVINAQNNITWCNDTSAVLLGLKIPQDIGQTVSNFLRDPDFIEWLSSEDREVDKLEMSSPINDNHWLQVTSVRFQQDQRLIVLRDITDVHNLEQVRRDFVANISHELRTPLTVLLGYLELLQHHAARDVSTAVERMHNQALQMKALLDDLLELSRLQSGENQQEAEAINIPALLERLKKQAEEISQGRHEMSFDIAPELGLVGSSADLESAFRNLIINAIRYTPDAGAINVSWHDSADGPRFTVQDSGIGIPKRDLPRLTERFYRVGPDRARRSGGTGLGLAIVKHVMNAHEARLVIRSELGEGSVFTCEFPRDRRVTCTSKSVE